MLIVFFQLLPPPPRSTLFPYTTLFRSHDGLVDEIKSNLESVENDFDITATPVVVELPAFGDDLRTLLASTQDDTEAVRSEEHTSELQSLRQLVCRLLLEKKNKKGRPHP